jgi:hypothetical protein
MTKTVKEGIFFIDMRITFKHALGQSLLILCVLFLFSCHAKKEDDAVVPPVTSPLTRDYIGFGVIIESFTHISETPDDESRYLGYLRRGSLVRVHRRQIVKTGSGFASWVLIEGSQSGWLKEEFVAIYENESQAKTASESMSR